MPSERFPPNDPREWMNRARSNLALAKNRTPDVYLEDLCFEAQQAAEKAIKALMIARSLEFPYVHDLVRLLSLVDGAGWTVPERVWRVKELTRYAVTTRYPDIGHPVSAQEYTDAVEIAEDVVRWAEENL